MDAERPPKDDPDRTQQVVDVRWGEAGSIPTLYANNLYISFTENQFYLVFGELSFPLILDFDSEKDRIPAHLEIKPIAKIAVSPTVMPSFVEAIRANFEKFETFMRTKKEKEQESTL